jgi:pimeloyl-ACP methyl ester carboxylesterase
MRLSTLALALLVAWPRIVVGQGSRVVNLDPRDSLAGSYRVYESAGKPVALLVLIPGGAATHDEFTPGGSTPSLLPQKLASHQVITIVPAGGRYSHWLEDGWLKQLDAIVAETLTTHRTPADRVVVGGFSAGGTAAVRYAEFCADGRSPARVRIQGGLRSRCTAGLRPFLAR